ncbi:Transcriptional regulator OS=Lysinibacillus sphaericus OX=1421 GN=LS41612_11910 PE=3 SV=1 [Lysinibacillus sphaericus]
MGELVVLHYVIYNNQNRNITFSKVAAAIELLIYILLNILDDIEDQDNLSSPWVQHQNLSLNISKLLTLFMSVNH